MAIKTDQLDIWKNQVEINSDPYGKACIDVARRVMELLDEVEKFNASDLINQADDETNTGGITGFMAGCVAKIVSQCHTRGDEFRVDWNKPYLGDREDTGGVVNPAILTLSK